MRYRHIVKYESYEFVTTQDERNTFENVEMNCALKRTSKIPARVNSCRKYKLCVSVQIQIHSEISIHLFI